MKTHYLLRAGPAVFIRSYFLWVTVFIFTYISEVKAQDPVRINNNTSRIEILGNRLMILEDKKSDATFRDVSLGDKRHAFLPNNVLIPDNINAGSAYWIRFKIQAEENLTERFIFEILDFKIDSFELYLPDANGTLQVYKGGDAYVFRQRDYFHKNFVIDVPFLKKGVYEGYIRIKARETVGFNFVISSYVTFLKYSNNEYLLLALFYGVVLVMAISNIFLSIYQYDRSHLFYSLYVISMALYFLNRDGLGFQYLWPESPWLNQYLRMVSVILIPIFSLLFAKYFLDITHLTPSFNRFLYIVIISFSLLSVFLQQLTFIFPEPVLIVWLPLLPICLYALRMAKSNQQARFLLIGYTVFFTGIIICFLNYFNLIPPGTFVYYSINFGVAGEMVILSLAMAGKVKHLIREKEMLKDAINSKLEEKVLARTLELEERNRQLDVFVYKASHDIRGPLKSMIGLSELALKELNDKKALEYFEHMVRTSNRLDGMVSELLKIGKVKDLELKYSDMDIHLLIGEILTSLKHLPAFPLMDITVNVPSPFMMRTDERMAYSVFQNVIENAIKYMDPAKRKPSLTITLKEEEKFIRFYFEDNGIGIPDNRKERIFDMFYRVKNDSSGTGLGLYLTKLSVEKLGGVIDLTSEEGKGTTFLVSFLK